MSLINVARAIRHPRLRQTFSVERNTGVFIGEGNYVVTPTTISRTGVIHPASEKEKLNFLPEGLRQSSAISIYCVEDLRISDGVGLESDVVIWQGAKYRIMFAKQWQQYGFWFGVGVAYTNA